jgi:DNA-binding XRE family transcriptional regulator
VIDIKIKNNLKKIRLKEYLIDSKTEFSKFLSVPLQTYSKWESGISTPTLQKALQISKKLNKTVNDIWFMDNI